MYVSPEEMILDQAKMICELRAEVRILESMYKELKSTCEKSEAINGMESDEESGEQ